MIDVYTKWEEDKRNTWSGTPWGILSSLKNICGKDNVQDKEIAEGKIVKLIIKVISHIIKIFGINECEVIEHRLDDRKMDRQLAKGDDTPSIMFSEYMSENLSNSYLYIDCSVDFVYRCQKHEKSFVKYMPLGKTSKKSLINVRKDRAEKFYNNCKGILTMSRWLQGDLIKNTGVDKKKVHCVGGGCNIDYTKVDDVDKESNKILFVGKDFERKGGQLVVRAYEIINKKYPGKYKLYIAGPAEMPTEIKGVSGIEFLGCISTEELVKYYNLCDIFVMPSYFEAYGIVFAEALIYGLPCIGRNAFAMKEFIKDGKNGYLINEDNDEYLADKMLQLLNNDAIKEYVKSKRQQYIKEYSWNSVAEKIIKVMKNDGYKL